MNDDHSTRAQLSDEDAENLINELKTFNDLTGNCDVCGKVYWINDMDFTDETMSAVVCWKCKKRDSKCNS